MPKKPDWITEDRHGEEGEHRYPVWYGMLTGQVDSYLRTMKYDPTSPTALDHLETMRRELKKQETEFNEWFWNKWKA
mgnify:CR=1 FL=1|tara:strand:- start:129 stop:359 length:231 start_codon:yes stop_codon:yes gene_type:complete